MYSFIHLQQVSLCSSGYHLTSSSILHSQSTSRDIHADPLLEQSLTYVEVATYKCWCTSKEVWIPDIHLPASQSGFQPPFSLANTSQSISSPLWGSLLLFGTLARVVTLGSSSCLKQQDYNNKTNQILPTARVTETRITGTAEISTLSLGFTLLVPVSLVTYSPFKNNNIFVKNKFKYIQIIKDGEGKDLIILILIQATTYIYSFITKACQTLLV